MLDTEERDSRLKIFSVARSGSFDTSVRLQRALLNSGSSNCSLKSYGSASLTFKLSKRDSRFLIKTDSSNVTISDDDSDWPLLLHHPTKNRVINLVRVT